MTENWNNGKGIFGKIEKDSPEWIQSFYTGTLDLWYYGVRSGNKYANNLVLALTGHNGILSDDNLSTLSQMFESRYNDALNRLYSSYYNEYFAPYNINIKETYKSAGTDIDSRVITSTKSGTDTNQESGADKVSTSGTDTKKSTGETITTQSGEKSKLSEGGYTDTGTQEGQVQEKQSGTENVATHDSTYDRYSGFGGSSQNGALRTTTGGEGGTTRTPDLTTTTNYNGYINKNERQYNNLKETESYNNFTQIVAAGSGDKAPMESTTYGKAEETEYGKTDTRTLNLTDKETHSGNIDKENEYEKIIQGYSGEEYSKLLSGFRELLFKDFVDIVFKLADELLTIGVYNKDSFYVIT